MYCPFCKGKLIPGAMQRFENVTDHVTNPNMEVHPLRPTFVCPNQECEMSQSSFWDEQGGWYLGEMVDIKKLFVWKRKHSNNTSAIGSWDRWWHNQQKFAEKIRPLFFFAHYKYDAASALTRFLFRWFEPPYRGV